MTTIIDIKPLRFTFTKVRFGRNDYFVLTIINVLEMSYISKSKIYRSNS